MQLKNYSDSLNQKEAYFFLSLCTAFSHAFTTTVKYITDVQLGARGNLAEHRPKDYLGLFRL